ncbi:MAG: hypothetical protein NTU61_03090, partial [Candidatus Altiarchaeota archaeon]|nr:hypothetical protein [Candidatus Altiarchaeota archaeon]
MAVSQTNSSGAPSPKKDVVISSLDILETLDRIKPLAFPTKTVPSDLTPERVGQIMSSIDPADPTIIHPMRELIRRTIDPGISQFAPGWSVKGPSNEPDGSVSVVVKYGTPVSGEATSKPRRFHARPAYRMYRMYNAMFRERCTLEVNNGLPEAGWVEASISDIINASNTGALDHIVFRAKDKPGKNGSSRELFERHIIPLIMRESWEDLMQTYGILLSPSHDIFKGTEVFRGVGSGTGISAYATLIYTDSFDVPPPALKRKSAEQLESEVARIHNAKNQVMEAARFRGLDLPEAQEVKKSFRTILAEVAEAAEQMLRTPLPADARAMLSGGKQSFMDAEMAVHQVVEQRFKPAALGDKSLTELYESMRREFLDELRGENTTSIWLQLTNGLEQQAPFVLVSPEPVRTSQIPTLIRGGFVGSLTPAHGGGVAGHLHTTARSDLFPTITDLFGFERADGYDILQYARYFRNAKCLIVDNAPSEGGA